MTDYPKIKLKEDSFPYVRDIILMMALTNVNTYFVDGSIHFQAVTRRYRSDNDIFGVCKYYFPKLNHERFITILAKLIKEKKIESEYCKYIQRQVFHEPFPKSTGFYTDLPKDGDGIAGNSETAKALRAKMIKLHGNKSS